MKSLLTLFALALIVPVAHAQDSKPLSAASVPLRADAPQQFAPRGWMIEKRVDGDLNRDHIADTALVLVENKAAKNAEGDPSERSRAFVVLLRQGKGWRRAGFNNSLLLGTRDGGAFYGVSQTPVEVQIKRGVLLVSMESGSREVEETTHRLRFERHLMTTPQGEIALTDGVFLIGFDSVTRDRATGGVDSETSNFLSGLKKTTTFKTGNDKSTTKTSCVSKRLRPLESLRAADRYSG